MNQYGKPYSSIQSVRDKLFAELLKKVGIEGKRLYDIRHSFASINLSKNRLPLLLVSKVMGHADSAVTLKEYSEYIPDTTKDTIELVNKAFENF